MFTSWNESEKLLLGNMPERAAKIRGGKMKFGKSTSKSIKLSIFKYFPGQTTKWLYYKNKVKNVTTYCAVTYVRGIPIFVSNFLPNFTNGTYKNVLAIILIFSNMD